MDDLTAVTKFFSTVNAGFKTSVSSTILSGAGTVPLTDVSGLVDGTVFVGIIEPGLTNQQVFTGTVDLAGNEIINVHWTLGNDVDHASGVTVVDYVSSTDWNMMSKGIQQEHNEDGTHGDINAESLTASGGVTTANLTASGDVDLPDDSITSAMVGFTKTDPDVNGWLKRDYGAWQQYEVTYTLSNQTMASGGLINVANVPLPAGIPDSSYLNFWVGGLGGYIGRIIPGIDNGNFSSPVTTIGVWLYNGGGASTTWNGSFTVYAITR